MDNLKNPLEYAVTLLEQGKLVAIPTETVYGLAADASNPIAVEKIYLAKKRPHHNPLIIHLPNQDAMPNYASHIPDAAWKLAERFWPGPLTLVLPRSAQVLDSVTGGQNTVALRIPNHPLTLELLTLFGKGLAAPSANRYGKISPTTAAHVIEELGETVDYILDGGPCQIGIESTIVYLPENSNPRLLRQGSISAKQLSDTLGCEIITTPKEKSGIAVPGSDISHYAPSKPLLLLNKDQLFKTAEQLLFSEHKKISVLSFSLIPKMFNTRSDFLIWNTVELDPERYAQHLYGRLRILDNTNSDYILVEAPPSTIEWDAIRDRLQRASTKI